MFYDPADPQQSVLDRSPPGFGGFVFPAAAIGFGALPLLVARQQAKSRGSSPVATAVA